MNAKSARLLFIAAVSLYLLWFGGLVALAVVSADRPAKARTRHMAAPAQAVPEPPND